MALTRIEYGSLASSAVMNNNFDYLDDRISGVAASLASNTATINSNIATLNLSITNSNEELQTSLTTLQNNFSTVLSDCGLYITTYINGTSWYREYFSDAEKTTRVWLEQGFTTTDEVWSNNDQKTYNLIKPFSNTNYTVIATSTLMYIANGVSSGSIAVENLQTDKITIGNSATNTFAVRVYACGI